MDENADDPAGRGHSWPVEPKSYVSMNAFIIDAALSSRDSAIITDVSQLRSSAVSSSERWN